MVLVDTCVWSLALRHKTTGNEAVAIELEDLIKQFRVQLIGPIRQELLSGIRNEAQFNKLKKRLEPFPDIPIVTEDYEKAAEYYNLCRAKGIQGSNTDFLICSVAVRNDFLLFTTDNDFYLFSRHLPIRFYKSKH